MATSVWCVIEILSFLSLPNKLNIILFQFSISLLKVSDDDHNLGHCIFAELQIKVGHIV